MSNFSFCILNQKLSIISFTNAVSLKEKKYNAGGYGTDILCGEISLHSREQVSLS